jgi:hypothetical protein
MVTFVLFYYLTMFVMCLFLGSVYFSLSRYAGHEVAGYDGDTG